MTKRQTMKSRTSRWAIRTTVMAASLAAATSTTSAIDPAFTYQGQLKQNGAPVTGLGRGDRGYGACGHHPERRIPGQRALHGPACV